MASRGGATTTPSLCLRLSLLSAGCVEEDAGVGLADDKQSTFSTAPECSGRLRLLPTTIRRGDKDEKILTGFSCSSNALRVIFAA